MWITLRQAVTASCVIMASTSLSIRIVLASGAKFGSAKIALLEAIEVQGSIAGAARSLGISRRTAWLALQSINCILCSPAVATETGGLKGGGATLTATGARVIALYRAIQSRAQSASANELQELGTVVRYSWAPGELRNRPFGCPRS